ncbi:MAG: phosphotransferase [Phycisphaeraceae bacterium]|nr:phosphotransferase [Phycisphaeraceae bacterium]
MSHPSHATQDEFPMPGGRYTVGVVRVGDTVRRPSRPWSPFVARLLRHLEQSGCDCVPRHLGQDDLGRDILSYIPGWVPAKFQRFADEQVSRAAVLLRTFHDATRGSELAGESPIVCHNDPGPNNTVFQDGCPVAFIDFDFAAPGEPLEDVGYMAWTWCVSSNPKRGLVEVQAAQLHVLADAYGLGAAERPLLVNAMMQRQSRNIRFWSERIDAFEGPATSREQIQERVDWSRRELEYTQAHRQLFLSALQ